MSSKITANDHIIARFIFGGEFIYNNGSKSAYI